MYPHFLCMSIFSWSNNSDTSWDRCCHYHKVNHKISWEWGWQARGDSPGSPHPLHMRCTFLQLSSFDFLLQLLLLSSCFTVVYYCMSFSSSATVFNHVIPRSFLSILSSPPFRPSLCALAPSLWHSVLMQTRSFFVLLVCHPPLLLSSLMYPFSQSLSNLFLLYHFSLS